MELLKEKSETEKRLDVIAIEQMKDLSEFFEKNKNSKAKLTLEINDRPVTVLFELGQAKELAEKFNIDLFPMMINQLLKEHVQEAKKEAETISDKPTTI
jgi:hypothetical protein